MPRVFPLVVLLLAATQAAAAAPAAEAVLSREIVRATEEARRNGEASLVELKDGSLLLLYGAHSTPGDWDRGEIRQIHSRDRGKTWSEPETLFSDPKRSLFQCSLARLQSGDLGLTHSSLANGTDAIKVFRRSGDEGKTWSEPVVISDKAHAYTTGPWDKLSVLESGRLLALLHCNLKPDTAKQGGPLGSYTVYSDDYGKTWNRGPAADVLHVAENPHRAHEWGFWEPSLVEHAPGKLLMLGRTPNGWLWESRSADNGTTWSMPVKTAVPNPVAPPVLTRVPGTDALVLIQNPEVDLKSGWHGGPRRALAFRTSTDGGRTWSEPTDLYRATEEKLWVDYPAIRWIDGNLHMVWRHIRQAATDRSATSLYHHVVPAAVFTADRGAAREELPAGEQSLEKIDLFEAKTGGYALYRIPGIIVTAKGTVLASCEARKSASSDWCTIDILLRRSTDGGRTWGEPQKLSDVPGPKQKNPMALKQKLATTDEVTYNNCVLVADRTGPVHGLYCLEYSRCFYVRSDDDGLTWSKPVEITKAFDAFRSEFDWKVLATGPAHGIQLRSGRLVVPVWLSTGTGGSAHRPSVAATIYSDDGGATWHRGAIAVPNTPEWINPNETVVVELADGRVMLNVRSESHRHRRLVTTGPDGASGWTVPTFDDALLEPICMASIVRHSLAGENRGRNRILFANPHWLERSDGNATPGGSRDRKNVSVKLSYDEGRTWPVGRSLEDGFSGYTDLAVLPDGTILCFHERGSIDGKNIYGTGRLTVARFNLAWLTDGADTGTVK